MPNPIFNLPLNMTNIHNILFIAQIYKGIFFRALSYMPQSPVVINRKEGLKE